MCPSCRSLPSTDAGINREPPGEVGKVNESVALSNMAAHSPFTDTRSGRPSSGRADGSCGTERSGLPALAAAAPAEHSSNPISPVIVASNKITFFGRVLAVKCDLMLINI